MGGVDFSSIHSSLKSLSVGSLCDGLMRLGFLLFCSYWPRFKLEILYLMRLHFPSPILVLGVEV